MGKIRKRAHFTLLEMLVVMSLLSVVAAVVGYQMISSTKGERFKAQSEMVLERVRLAQEMMMLGKDLTLYITKVGDDEWFLEMVPKIRGDQTSSKLLNATNNIQGIESITYYSRKEGYAQDRQIELPFISKGGEMADGELVFVTKDWEKRLELPGYPTHLSFKRSQEGFSYFQNWYPQEVMEKYEKTKIEEVGHSA